MMASGNVNGDADGVRTIISRSGIDDFFPVILSNKRVWGGGGRRVLCSKELVKKCAQSLSLSHCGSRSGTSACLILWYNR
jgi:hypothetical protein